MTPQQPCNNVHDVIQRLHLAASDRDPPRRDGRLRELLAELERENSGGYEALAAQLEVDPPEPLLQAFEPLWSNSVLPEVAALLTYRCLLQTCAASSSAHAPPSFNELTANLYLIFVTGLNNLFWRDVGADAAHTPRFAPLYSRLLTACEFSPAVARLPERLQQDLHLLACRYFLFYRPAAQLVAALRHGLAPRAFHQYDTDAKFSAAAAIEGGPDMAASLSLLGRSDGPYDAGGPTTAVTSENDDRHARIQGLAAAEASPLAIAVFLQETTRQMYLLRREATLVIYLEGLASLQGQAMDAFTRNRLQTALHAFQAPGGPLYPTRRVRHSARRVMDALFPAGRHVRRAVHLAFRLLHPLRWPASLTFWLRSVGAPAAAAAVLRTLSDYLSLALALCFLATNALGLDTAWLERFLMEGPLGMLLGRWGSIGEMKNPVEGAAALVANTGVGVVAAPPGQKDDAPAVAKATALPSTSGASSLVGPASHVGPASRPATA